MTAAERLSRLLALVPWLAANDGVTLDEAAARFGISTAELESDLWLLIVCGLPGYGPADLVDIQFWDDGRIHVLDPQTLRRPLRLTSGEATALALGLRLLAQVPGAAEEEALASAMSKLEAAIEAAAPNLPEVSLPAAQEHVDGLLRATLASGHGLQLRYASGTRDEITDRVVQPLRIVSVDGRTSLVAYCSLAEEVRTFRIDRILHAEAAAALDLSGVGLEGGSGEESGLPVLATVRLEPGVRWLAETPGARILGEGAEGSLEVLLPAHDLGWLAREVLRAGPGAVVIGPAAAVEAVRGAAEAALDAYSGEA